MKLIEALIPCDMIQRVEQTLTSLGVKGLSISSVYQSDPAEPLPAQRDVFLGTPCCKLDLLLCDGDVSRVQSALVAMDTTPPRLRILIRNVETMIRIRTGESQESALE